MPKKTTRITFNLTIKQFIAFERAVDWFHADDMNPWNRQQLAFLKRMMNEQLADALPQVRNEIEQTKRAMDEEERSWSQRAYRQGRLMELRDLMAELGDVSPEEWDDLPMEPDSDQ